MAEYIEREAAIRCCTFGRTSLGLIGELRRLPSADVVEVRHGRWIAHDVIENMKCSECGEEYRMPFDFNANVYPYNFCPNCGAKMDGGAENG